MIETTRQSWLADWLCDKIGLIPTPMLMCIGNVRDSKIVGVVGYDQYNGASVIMHAAGDSSNWLSRDMLWAVFDYPFNVLGAKMIIGLVPSANTDALKFNKHIGFRVRQWLYGAHPDGALVLMTMAKDECRYLEIRHGQKEQAACST